MLKFITGETVTCKCTCTVGGVLHDPATGVVIYIYDSAGTAVVNGVAVPKETTGIYPYDYQSTTLGTFRFLFVVTDGAKISKKDSSFEIVAQI